MQGRPYSYVFAGKTYPAENTRDQPSRPVLCVTPVGVVPPISRAQRRTPTTGSCRSFPVCDPLQQSPSVRPCTLPRSSELAVAAMTGFHRSPKIRSPITGFLSFPASRRERQLYSAVAGMYERMDSGRPAHHIPAPPARGTPMVPSPLRGTAVALLSALGAVQSQPLTAGSRACCVCACALK